jgi:hypothetical protein
LVRCNYFGRSWARRVANVFWATLGTLWLGHMTLQVAYIRPYLMLLWSGSISEGENMQPQLPPEPVGKELSSI